MGTTSEFPRFRDDKEGATLDLKVKSKDAGLEELLSLIPGVYTEKLKNYDYEGKVNFDLHISGATGGKALHRPGRRAAYALMWRSQSAVARRLAEPSAAPGRFRERQAVADPLPRPG